MYYQQPFYKRAFISRVYGYGALREVSVIRLILVPALSCLKIDIAALSASAADASSFLFMRSGVLTWSPPVRLLNDSRKFHRCYVLSDLNSDCNCVLNVLDKFHRISS